MRWSAPRAAVHLDQQEQAQCSGSSQRASLSDAADLQNAEVAG